MDRTAPTHSCPQQPLALKELHEKMLESYQLRHDDCVATGQVVDLENEARITKAEADISLALKELAAAKNLAKGAQIKSKTIDASALIFDASRIEDQQLLDYQHLQQRKDETASLEANALRLARETAAARVQDARDRLVEVKAEALRKEADAKAVEKYVRGKVYDYMEKWLDLDSRAESVESTATGIPTNKDAGPRVEIPMSTASVITTKTGDDQRLGKAEADLRSARLSLESYVCSNPLAVEFKLHLSFTNKTVEEAALAAYTAMDHKHVALAAVCATPGANGQAERAAYLAACDANNKARLEFIETCRQTKSAAQKHWKESMNHKAMALKAYCIARSDWQAARAEYYAAGKALDQASLEDTETREQVDSAAADVRKATLDIMMRSLLGYRVFTAEMALERARAEAERKKMGSRRE